jgi:hypothetical protein
VALPAHVRDAFDEEKDGVEEGGEWKDAQVATGVIGKPMQDPRGCEDTATARTKRIQKTLVPLTGWGTCAAEGSVVATSISILATKI